MREIGKGRRFFAFSSDYSSLTTRRYHPILKEKGRLLRRSFILYRQWWILFLLVFSKTIFMKVKNHIVSGIRQIPKFSFIMIIKNEPSCSQSVDTMAFFYAVHGGFRFWICRWNPRVWPFKWIALSCDAVYCAVKGGSNFEACGWNPRVWPFKWKLLSCNSLWCCTRWFYLNF